MKIYDMLELFHANFLFFFRCKWNMYGEQSNENFKLNTTYCAPLIR